MRPLPQQTVKDATIRLRNGESIRQVAKSLQISAASVSRIRQTDEENIPNAEIGRPSKATKKTKALLARHFRSGKATTLREGQQLIQSVLGIKVHPETVRNYLEQQGLKATLRPRKPNLSSSQIAARYEFAKAHLNWTVDDWKHVMFSDETIISRIEIISNNIRMLRSQDPDRKNTQPGQVRNSTQGGRREKFMIWGCMTYHGVGDACWLQEKVNAPVYLDVVQEYVLASRDWYRMNRKKFIFQQDTTRIHTAAVVMKFFEKSKVTLLDWPANSSDINPIEHVWAHLEHRLDQYPEAPSSMEELWERIQDIWTAVPLDLLHELYENMPGCMEKLYRNNGGHIKY